MSKTTAYYNQVYNKGYRDGLEAAGKAQLAAARDDALFAFEGMRHMLDKMRGYFRLGKGGSVYYTRWKWLEPAPQAGYYTFRSSESLTTALTELYDVALLIEAGKAKASLDKPKRR